MANFDPIILNPNHCTIVAIPTNKGYLLGHNEDWEKKSLYTLYILDAIISGNHIFGLNYVNNIIGSSIAINQYGLVEAVNELLHNDEQLGVPKNFIARAILDCKTLEAAEALLRGFPRAGGYNHVLVQNEQLWNIESTAKEYAIEKSDHKKYVHTNHYLTSLKKFDKGNLESQIRYKKVVSMLPKINTISDVKNLLSNTENPPIAKTDTIGSVIFDTERKSAYVTYGQPNPTSYQKITY